MSTMYSTITQKGQITLPAGLRHKLGLIPGVKVAMREVSGTIVIDPPGDMDAIRARARKEMEVAGTWGTVIDKDDVWTAVAEEKLGNNG